MWCNGIIDDNCICDFYEKVGRECRIPFEISADPICTENNLKHIKDSMNQINEGNTVVKTMDELEKTQ